MEHWSKQVEVWAKATVEMQRIMSEAWLSLMRVPFAGSTVLPSSASWRREPVAQEFPGRTGEVEPAVRDVVSRFFTAQHLAWRSLSLSLNAWKAWLPRIEAGRDWQSGLRQYVGQFRQECSRGPQAVARTIQEMSELWRLYGEQWQKLSRPWAESLKQAPWRMGQAVTGDGSALIELANLCWDAYERTIGCLLESPSLGYTRELNQDLLQGFDTWMEYRRAAFEYQVIVADAWTQAFERWLRELVARGEKGEPLHGLRQLLFLWVDICDQVFGEVFRSEEYTRIQNRLVNMAATYRLREMEIVEALLKTGHVPTRGELDEAYRRIYELRKEVKTLKKQLHETQAELAAHVAREPAARTTERIHGTSDSASA